MKLVKNLLITASLLVFAFVASPIYAVDPSPTPCITNAPNGTPSACVMVNTRELGFTIPNFSDILTFAIRAVFVFGGLAALFFLLLGAFGWITSGGEKDKVKAAQDKIQAAVVGVIMIAVVLSIVVALEQVVFGGKLCFGLSCPITIPTLLKDANAPTTSGSGVLQHIAEPSFLTPTPTLSVTPSISPSATIPPEELPVVTQTGMYQEQNHLYATPTPAESVLLPPNAGK